MLQASSIHASLAPAPCCLLCRVPPVPPSHGTDNERCARDETVVVHRSVSAGGGPRHHGPADGRTYGTAPRRADQAPAPARARARVDRSSISRADRWACPARTRAAPPTAAGYAAAARSPSSSSSMDGAIDGAGVVVALPHAPARGVRQTPITGRARLRAADWRARPAGAHRWPGHAACRAVRVRPAARDDAPVPTRPGRGLWPENLRSRRGDRHGRFFSFSYS